MQQLRIGLLGKLNLGGPVLLLANINSRDDRWKGILETDAVFFKRQQPFIKIAGEDVTLSHGVLNGTILFSLRGLAPGLSTRLNRANGAFGHQQRWIFLKTLVHGG